MRVEVEKPGGAADLAQYLKIISRGCYTYVPSFMRLTRNARFNSNMALNLTIKKSSFMLQTYM